MRFGNDMITFEEAVAYLKDMPRFTVKKNPADSRDLKWFLKKLGNPEKDLRIIHVAGTNGKGSVCSYINAVLEEAGYSPGLFVSPHLVDVRERFRLKGQMISKEDFTEIFMKVLENVENFCKKSGDCVYHPTFFEMRCVLLVVLPHLWRKTVEQKSLGYIPLFCSPGFPVLLDK